MKKELKSMMDRFSFAQMTSNENGKTSASGTMGILICFVGTLCFFLGCVDKMFLNKDIDVITQSIIFVGIGAGLLGFRKSRTAVDKKEVVSNEVLNPQMNPQAPVAPSNEQLNQMNNI
jgi:hypothetical protein